MLITKHVRLKRVVIGTWKESIAILIVCISSYLFNEYILSNYFQFPAIIDAILGTALAFFIGFSNNQAYDRWWEARKIWGALVNDSRSWARQVLIYPHTENESEKDDLDRLKKQMISRHIGFLYALKDALRGENSNDFKNNISEKEYAEVVTKSNIQNAILNLQSRDLQYMKSKEWIDGFGFLQLNKLLNGFTDQMGMSERIKNTVFPPTYNHYTRLFIWILIISSTFVISDSVGPWAILFGFLLGYVFLVTHTIGQVLLNPFEKNPSAISLNQITRTIEINLLETIGETNLPEPVKSVNGEYIL